MLTILNPKRGLSKTQAFRPDLITVDDFKEEIKTEILHSVLFANDEVIKSLVEFIRCPDHASYIKTVVSMRKDLWRKKTSVDEEVLNVLYEKELKSGKNLVVKIPKNLISKDYVEKFIERIELEMLIEKSQMTDKEAWKLSEEIKEDWWKKNKVKYLNG